MVPEHIPDHDEVYRKCHYSQWDFDNNEPEAAAFGFDQRDGTISTFWTKYITAGEMLRAFFNPRTSGALSLLAGRIREGGILDVLHTPNQPQGTIPGHASITMKPGFNEVKARAMLVSRCGVAIPVPRR